jgi:hypothetical protein
MDPRWSGAPMPSARQTVTLALDPAQTWFSALAPRLDDPKARISGATLGDAVFCLRVLAADKGWHLIARDSAGRLVPSATEDLTAGYTWSLAPNSHPSNKGIV